VQNYSPVQWRAVSQQISQLVSHYSQCSGGLSVSKSASQSLQSVQWGSVSQSVSQLVSHYSHSLLAAIIYYLLA
jgi:hypothetical protein